MWQRQLKSDPVLAEQYKACGRGYDFQRIFKVNWATKEFEKASQVSTYTDTNMEHETMPGEYEPLSVIACKKKSKVAGLNYVMECLRLHEAGGNFRGKPLVSFNMFTKFWEFMFTRQQFGTVTTKKWETVDTSKTTLVTASGSAAPGRAALPAGVAKQDPSPPADKKKKAEPKKKATETGDDDKSGAASMAKKAFEGQLAGCKTLKTRCVAVQSQAFDILNAIKTNKAWDFGLSRVAECELFRSKLDKLKEISEFWQMWSTSSWAIFATWTKKNYTMQDTIKELKLMSQIEEEIANIEAWNQKTQRMYQASRG